MVLARKLMQDHRGAVTIFVTLLLIPAIIVTGSAVDVARIYAMRGIVKDANQLAANSALAYYDGLLKDVYGLFAISQENPELGSMLDAYIQASVFEEGGEEGDYFTFFRGGGSAKTSVTYPGHTNLANPQVLRRQIEEYMKFRGPVVLVRSVLDRVDQFTKLKNDTDAIFDKLKIDEDFSDLGKKYELFYQRLRYNDYYVYQENAKGLEPEIYTIINRELENIHTIIKRMSELQEEYAELYEELENLSEPSEEDDDTSYEAEKRRIEAAMEALRKTFNTYQTDIPKRTKSIIDAINSRIKCSHGKKYYEKFSSGCCLKSYEDNLSELVTLAKDITKAVEELRKKIKNLNGKLGDCSEELAGDENNGLRHELAQYEAFFFDNLTEMTQELKSINTPYLHGVEEHLKGIAEGIAYGDVDSNNTAQYPNGVSFSTLISMINNADVEGLTSQNSGVVADASQRQADFERIAAFTNYQYKRFYESAGQSSSKAMQRFCGMSNEAQDLYIQLSNMYYNDSESDKSSQKSIRKMLNSVGKDIKTSMAGLTDWNPDGADYIPQAMIPSLPSQAHVEFDGHGLAQYFDNSSFSDAGKNNKAAQSGLSIASKIFKRFGNVMGSVADKGLLLTYDSEMFSSFPATLREGSTTISGIPMGTRMNYMYGSELEYLFIGAKTERENLTGTANLLFLTRFVFNYIATFTITDVKSVLNGVQAAFSWSGPFAIVIKELARVGMAMGEAAMDVMHLRAGKPVAVFKSNKSWEFLSLTSLLQDVGEGIANAALDSLVTQIKTQLLAKLSDLKGTWGSVKGQITETLNQAEEIDNLVESLTGEGTGISELSGELKNAMDGFDSGLKELGDSITDYTAPPISLGDKDLPETNLSSLDRPSPKREVEFYYEDYVRIYLFLFVDGDTLGKRTADLIALNVTNYKNNVNGSAEAMEGCALYDMSTAQTFLVLETEVDLDFIFLSMPMFSTDGLSPPKSFPIREIDYRGY